MWKYGLKVINKDNIPEGAYGFVYRIDVVVDGCVHSYIGKKNFYSERKVKLGKKELPTDKRLKTYKVVKKVSNFEKYWGSCEPLLEVMKHNPKNREILAIAFSKAELTYLETKMLFVNNVLEDNKFFNTNILGKFFKGSNEGM